MGKKGNNSKRSNLGEGNTWGKNAPSISFLPKSNFFTAAYFKFLIPLVDLAHFPRNIIQVKPVTIKIQNITDRRTKETLKYSVCYRYEDENKRSPSVHYRY
jgi:hypothetical protein